MNATAITAITAFISIVGVLSGIVLGWQGKARTMRQDAVNEAGKDARMQIDVEYIKRGVDDVRIEQKAQGKHFEELSERVTRVEESAKQAHLRIDEFRKG